MLQNVKDYVIHELIAEGKNSLIYRAERKSDKATVIIKMLKAENTQPKDLQHMTHEFELLSKLNTPHVIKAFDLVSTHNSLFLVMEFFPSKTLAAFIEKEKKVIFLPIWTLPSISLKP